MLTAANKNFRSIGAYFTNFYRSASSVDSVSQEIYSQQAFYIYYTSPALSLSGVHAVCRKYLLPWVQTIRECSEQ